MLVKEHPICLAQDINFNLYTCNTKGGEHKINKTKFNSSGEFGSKQLMLLDIFTTLAFHNTYNNKGYEIEFNEFLFDNKKTKITNKFNFNKENLIQDILDIKPITIEFTDKYLRKKLPCIDKIKKQDLFKLINNLSKNIIKMRYPIYYYNDGKFIKNVETSTTRFESCLFSLEFSKVKSIINYKITFDTILGKLLMNNVLSVHRGIVIDKFYKLNSTTQMLYRYFMLHQQGHMKKDLDIKEIKNKLNLKSSEYDLIRIIIPKCLESLKQNNFISKWVFDQMTTKFKYEHVGLKHQKIVYLAEQLAGSIP